MRKTIIAALAAILLLCACDKAEETVCPGGFVAAEAISGSILVLNSLGETVSVLTEDAGIINDVFKTGSSPNEIIVDYPHVCIINSLSNSILVLNADTLTLTAETALGPNRNPHYGATVEHGVLAVSCFKQGCVAIVDLNSGTVQASIPLNDIVLPRDDASVAGRCYPSGVAVAGDRIFVTLTNLDDHQGGLTAAGKGAVAVIDTETFSLIDINPATAAIDPLILNGWDPVYAASHGGRIVVACAGHYSGNISGTTPGGFVGDGSFHLIDSASLSITDIFPEGCAPFTFSIDSEGLLFASNAMASGIPVIDLTAARALDNIPFNSAYVSAVLADKGLLYALDFAGDLLTVLEPQIDRTEGTTTATRKTAMLTGDGPIALAAMPAVSAEEFLDVQFSITPQCANAGQEVSFDASGTLYSGGLNDLDFQWDFGDGSRASGITATHSYSANTEYEVTLRVYSPAGTVVEISGAVTISDLSPFAIEVVDFSPAPGQFVTNPSYNNPQTTLGETDGQICTLGGFGGSITLAFNHEVLDDPLNPDGYDFIVYGNAFAGWSEPGIVEISQDGLTWYLIPGSSLPVNAGEPHYTPSDYTYDNGETFAAYQLPQGLSDGKDASGNPIWGYADTTAGGDYFDIAWAVDPVSGQPANLESFRYIRISNPVNESVGECGEVSPEIDAVKDI